MYTIESQKQTKLVEPLFKHHRRFLMAIGLWSLDTQKTSKWRNILYRIHSYHVLLLWMVLFILCMFIELMRCFGELQAMIQVFIILATDVAMYTKYHSFRTKSRLYKNLVKDLSSPQFSPRNLQEEQILRAGVQVASRTTTRYTLASLAAVVAMTSRSILDGSFILPAAAYYPFDVSNLKTFCIMYTYQTIGLMLQCSMNITSDTLASNLQIFAGSQTEILCYRLENLDKSMLDSKLEREIEDCIRFHHKILKFVERLELGISIPYTVQMFASSVVICVNFYTLSFVSPVEDITNFYSFVIYQLCMLAQIFIVCYYGNELLHKSSRLGFSLYSCNWFNWSRKNKRSLLIMLLRFRLPIRIRALSFFSFDLITFTSVLNSAYSYFAILKKINN